MNFSKPISELQLFIQQGRAKQLYAAGFKTIADIASAKPEDLVQQISHINMRHAEMIIKAAKLSVLTSLEELQELVEEMKDVVKPNRKSNRVSR